MKQRSALHAARDQLVWIFALIASTIIVVQLERIDVGASATVLARNPFDASTSEITALLERTKAQSDGSDQALISQSLAVTLALLMDASAEDLRAEGLRVLSLLEARARTGDDPLIGSAKELLIDALADTEKGM